MPDVLVLDSRFFLDPYPTYATLREAGGAHEAVLPSGHKVWLVARYADARSALADPRLSKRLNAATSLFERHQQDPARRGGSAQPVVEHMLNSDPPTHTRLRRLVGGAFTRYRMRALRPVIEGLAAGLLDELSTRNRVVDVVDEYAFPLATAVLAELLGIPEQDRVDFHRWATSIVDGGEAGSHERARADADEMIGYLVRLVAQRRADPRDDALSLLARTSQDADGLTDFEVVLTAFLLVVAGHDTMVGLVGNGILALLRHPEQRARLTADPELMPGAVDELLRYAGPASFSTLRYTTAPVEVGDVTIPAGEFVVVALDSANRDPQRFAEPDRLDIRRPARGHMAFGYGIHHCVGAPLARMVGDVAIGLVLGRFPRLRLAAEATELSWLATSLLRGVERLPVLLRD